MAALTMYRLGNYQAERFEGTLFSLIPELGTPAQVAHYQRANLGWSHCPLGYSLYKFVSGPDQFVIPGIYLKDHPAPRRKFPAYPLKFTKEQIEAIADEVRGVSDLVEAESSDLIGNLTHDLRGLSGQIYNAAEMLRIHLSSHSYGAAFQKADTVIAAQQMLSLRLDMLDYSTGMALEKEPERIPVYKKFDKVLKCLEPEASLNEVKLDIHGPSQGYTYGIPVFELVPLVLLENAVKYAPKKSIVLVKISDFPRHIDAHVQSFGPKITRAEEGRLFEQGFRAEAARKTGKSGSGLGLFAANSLLEGSFNGQLSMTQDPVAINMNDNNVWRTTFSCRVPRVA